MHKQQKANGALFHRHMNRLVNQAAEHVVAAKLIRAGRQSITAMMMAAKLKAYASPAGHAVKRVKYTRTAWNGKALARLLSKAQLRQCRQLEHGERLVVTPAAKVASSKSTKSRKAA